MLGGIEKNTVFLRENSAHFCDVYGCHRRSSSMGDCAHHRPHLALVEQTLVSLVRNDHRAWNPWAIVVRRLVELYPSTVVDDVPVYLLCHVVRF